jgi:hypothetical protein
MEGLVRDGPTILSVGIINDINFPPSLIDILQKLFISLFIVSP